MTTPSPGAGTCRVLLAEDEPLNVMLAQEVLHMFGCAVEVVGTGSAALEAVKARAFDVVLLDFHMPGMTGVEAAAAIRHWEQLQQRDPLRILGLTASAMPDDIKQCLKAGMDQVITKPFDIEQLRRTLASACCPPGAAGGCA